MTGPFQLALGLAEKEIGMARALNAKELWRDQAETWLLNLDLGTQFTADDLLSDCGTPAAIAVNANNAVGAYLNGASRRGLIRAVSRRPSTRASNHGRFITVWER